MAEAAHAPVKCLIGPADRNMVLAAALSEPCVEPTVLVDRDQGIVAIDGPDLAGVGEAFQLLRTAVRSEARLTTTNLPVDATSTYELLATEVWHTFPSFELRGLDWARLVDAHRDGVLSEGTSLESLQRWFAELQDAHTWVKDSRVNARLPYHAWIDEQAAWLTYVPRWSAAWAAGVRAGDVLLDVDCEGWWSRTSATPRSRSMVTGYRWLAGPVGSVRELRAVGPDGTIRTLAGTVRADAMEHADFVVGTSFWHWLPPHPGVDFRPGVARPDRRGPVRVGRLSTSAGGSAWERRWQSRGGTKISRSIPARPNPPGLGAVQHWQWSVERAFPADGATARYRSVGEAGAVPDRSLHVLRIGGCGVGIEWVTAGAGCGRTERRGEWPPPHHQFARWTPGDDFDRNDVRP